MNQFMVLKKNLKLKLNKKTTANSRYKIFGFLAEFKDGFVLGKLVHNGKISHL